MKSVSKVPAWPGAASVVQARERSAAYMQVILPDGELPADYIKTIRAWPSVEEAGLRRSAAEGG